MRRGLNIIAVVLFAGLFASVIAAYGERQSLSPLAQSYVERVPAELGIPNVITGILLAYRSFDTLGEVAVLFMVAAGVGLILKGGGKQPQRVTGKDSRKGVPPSEIVRTGAEVLVPLIAIFSAYIIMNGHLSAGGGFQGGAVVASGTLLFLLANPDRRVDLQFLSITESVAGLFFIAVGIAGLIFASGFLDTRVLPLGTFGKFFSGGAVPVLSACLGLKVGCELSVIVDRFRS
jgi:multicomponent Na+:H+ antiporter subunit B